VDKIKRGVAWGKTGKAKTYHIYMKEEADDQGIEYTEWKKCEPGHYSVTDDGWVALLLKKKTYTNKNGVSNTYYVFPFKSFFATKKHILNYEDYRGTYYRLNGASNKTIKELKLQSYVNAPAASLMVDCYLRTGDRMAAFRFAFPNKKLGKYWGKKLVDAVFKQDKVKKMIREQVKEELEKAGLNPVSVLEKLDDTWTVASDKKNVDNMLSCIDKYEEYLNFKKDENEIPNSISGGAMQAIAAAFEQPATLVEETKTKMEEI
jgi:hypothetical protein|tara:strand:+ start:1835 stop:2620 length:786 start_codon:yes stop_codon:yes gene_type:complete